MPLLMFCQEKEETIYKNSKGNWELDQTTTEASYYAIQERDSLISEVTRLRMRVTSLEDSNTELLNKAVKFFTLLQEQVLINQSATTELNEVNDEIISIWSKMYKGARLDVNLFSDFKNQVYTSAILSVPIDLNWSINFTPMYGIKSPVEKIQYFFGVNYNVF